MKGYKGNYIDGFYDWMIRKGKKPKKREIPSEPMSPIGAKGKLRLLRRILVDLQYVNSEKVKGNGYVYKVWPAPGLKRLDGITPGEFTLWMDNEFPSCRDRKAKQRKSAYVLAAWKFGEFLVYEQKDSNGKAVWNKKQLSQIKEEIYPPAIERFEVEILEVNKIDGLLEFIKTRNFTHYTMIYFSRWLGGMRYQEVINSHENLKTGTLHINLRKDKTTVYGKGKGGLQKPRYPTLLPQVKEVLLEYLKIRKTMDPATEKDSQYLFLTAYGKKWAENSGHFNESLRDHAKAWGKLTEEEILLISTHRIGRHGFGTYFYPKMPEKLLMQEMGLEDPKMLHRYSNIKREQRASMMIEASKDNGNFIQEVEQPRTDKLSQLRELLGGLSKEEKLKLLSELI